MRSISCSWTGLAIAATFLASPAGAQTEAVTLEMRPETIAVSPSYGEVQARVVVKNGLKEPIRQLELAAFSNDGLNIQIGKPSTGGAQAGQSVVWIIKITDPAHARLPASAQFELKYRKMDQTTCYRAFIALSLTSDAGPKPVESTLEGNFDSISQQRDGEGAVLVTNNLDLPVDIQIKTWPGSESMTIDPIAGFQIPPRSTIRTPVKIKTVKRITPGVYPAAFEVIANWTWAGRTEERHVVVSKNATIGVFFESELLKALGIPSFLVLPGCLVIFTMQLLLAFNFMGAKNESKLPDLGITTPSFWILSITYSALYAWAYIGWTKNNYLVRYGLEDLMLVWISSIFIGFLLYVSLAGWTAKNRRLKVPTPTDDPITVLQKLARNKLGVVAPQVQFTLNNAAWRGFVIEPLEDGKTLLWVAPAMLADWGTTQEARTAQTAHNQDLAMAMDPNSAEDRDVTAARIAARLADARQRHLVEVRWDAQGDVPTVASPMHIKADTIRLFQPPARIIT